MAKRIKTRAELATDYIDPARNPPQPDLRHRRRRGRGRRLHSPVELRLANAGKVRAFADIRFSLGPAGSVSLSGFSVCHADVKAPRVVPPARNGTHAISMRSP